MPNRKRVRKSETSKIHIVDKQRTRRYKSWWMVAGIPAKCVDGFMVLTHASQSIIILRGDTIEGVRPSEAKWD